MHSLELLGSTLGLALVAGIRLYASVLAIGLGLRLGVLQLPHHLDGLTILAHPAVISAAALAYFAEFFADKISWVDTLWDTFHLLIRPIGAALLAFTAVGSLEPVAQTVVVLLCGGLALSTHSTKAGFRLIVNHSPEPFSNIGVSLAEDVFAIGMTWLALAHPLVTLGTVGLAFAGIVVLAPKLFRLLRVEALAIAALIKKCFGISASAGR